MQFKKIIFTLAVSLVLVSCMFTEEIHINNNGSGTYTFKMDMSKMMESMGEFGKKDSLKEPEKLDSILFFKDILAEKKDSISQLPKDEQEMLKSLKDLRLHMQMDEEKGTMNMEFIFDFKNISQLKNIQERVQKAQSMSDKKKSQEQFPSRSDVTYSFKNNIFKRTVTLKKLTKEELKSYEESINRSNEIFDETMYRVVYHFEDKIQKVSIDNVTISDDKKTLTIEMPLDTILKNPFLLNFEVKLK